MEFPSFEEISSSLEPIDDFEGIKIIVSAVFDPLIEADRIIISGVCRLPSDTEENESENKGTLLNSVVITCVREKDSSSYSEKLIKEPSQEENIETVDSESNQNESVDTKETMENNFRTGFFSVDLTAHFTGLDIDGKYYVVSSIREHTSNVLEIDKLEPAV